MKTPQEWSTIALQTTFRKDFEKLIQDIQEDARKELKDEIDYLTRTLQGLYDDMAGDDL